MTGTWIERNPNPHARQYTRPRRATPTGAIVIHTAENTTDITLPDGGAEAVASYISRRTTPGSYHSIVDSDSHVRVVPYEWEAWHEGTGGNRWSLGLSFACRADQWPTLPPHWIPAAIHQGAAEAARMNQWLHTTHQVTVPARRITAAQYRNGQPGFISHAELDPRRRSDPGEAFPWGTFLNTYAAMTNHPTSGAPPAMATPGHDARVQAALNEIIGLFDLDIAELVVDDDIGPKSATTAEHVLGELHDWHEANAGLSQLHVDNSDRQAALAAAVARTDGAPGVLDVADKYHTWLTAD
ncbi:MAG: N-acetylmuramoyl-L-alanine amidase [Actinomycetota bacterium]